MPKWVQWAVTLRYTMSLVFLPSIYSRCGLSSLNTQLVFVHVRARKLNLSLSEMFQEWIFSRFKNLRQIQGVGASQCRYVNITSGLNAFFTKHMHRHLALHYFFPIPVFKPTPQWTAFQPLHRQTWTSLSVKPFAYIIRLISVYFTGFLLSS